ncbi:MAG: cupredoxin domain-containing protein, partial [Chloroflexi bacterium]|nr:cupredoxin domain-containing protein [Chloroflexota bacterium]
LPSVVYYHPVDTPPPPAVGKLPVPASEVTWDGNTWEVTSDTFVPAGAMHLANELNWIGPHLGSIPFPPVADADSGQVPSDGAPVTSATIVGKNIAFDVDALTVPAGQEVTITFDNQDAAVPHNLHVQAGPEGDFKTEIVNGPVLQTLTFEISEPGSYTFVCDVHPNQMAGTIVVK